MMLGVSIGEFKHLLSEVNWESATQLKNANNVDNRFLYISSGLCDLASPGRKKIKLKNLSSPWMARVLKKLSKRKMSFMKEIIGKSKHKHFF